MWHTSLFLLYINDIINQQKQYLSEKLHSKKFMSQISKKFI